MKSYEAEMVATESTRLVERNYKLADAGNTPVADGSTTTSLDARDIEQQQGWPSRSCCNDTMKSIVFGALDGIITALTVQSATTGADFSWQSSLSISISVVIASSVSMGLSEFLSSKAHKEYLLAEKRKELWEFKNFREQEIQHMIELFESKGMIKKDAEVVVNKIALYDNCFINLMVSEELGLSIPPEENDSALLTDAIIMLLSFGGFGLFSLVPFVFVGDGALNADDGYFVFMAWGLFLVTILGASKSAFSNSSALNMGMESIILSGTCAVVAYFVGDSVIRMLGDEK